MMIGNELLQAYEDAEKHPEWKPLGDKCDIEAWDLVKKRIEQDENHKD
jgi:1-deoxy-D-xylulose 5-phosphate reductoisomerase